MTLSCATTPGQSGPRSIGNEEILCIPQSSSITEASPSDCLVSYQGHSVEGSYPFPEKQSVYSTALADWAKERKKEKKKERNKEVMMDDKRKKIKKGQRRNDTLM